jgi:hypothetical protein
MGGQLNQARSPFVALGAKSSQFRCRWHHEPLVKCCDWLRMHLFDYLNTRVEAITGKVLRFMVSR